MSARQLGAAAAVIATAVLLSVPSPAAALRYSGYLGTTVYGYDAVEPDEIHAETYIPVRFNVDQEIGEGSFGLVANTRLYKDLGGEEDLDGRVYYSYLRYKAPGSWLEANVGRQYIAAGVTAATLDGARFKLRGGKKWRADVYGGTTVTPDYGPMRRFSEPEETAPADDRGYWLDHYTYGAHGGVNLDQLWEAMPFPVWFGGGGSVSKKNSHVSDVQLGIDAREEPRPGFKTSQELHFDWIGSHIDYQYYSARYRFKEIPLRTYLDYRWTEPRFDYTSLFSVFAQEGRHRWRLGGSYTLAERLEPFADYSLTARGDNLGHRLQGGLVHNYDYFYLRYGGLYGQGNRSVAGGEEVGGFASVEFPRPLPSFDRLSAGISGNYIRYQDYDLAAVGWENAQDVAFIDLHGRLKVCPAFGTTLGAEVLRNPGREYDIRAYLQANASLSH